MELNLSILCLKTQRVNCHVEEEIEVPHQPKYRIWAGVIEKIFFFSNFD